MEASYFDPAHPTPAETPANGTAFDPVLIPTESERYLDKRGLALEGNPVTLGWIGLNYFVTIKMKKEKVRRHLLQDVTGVARPGHLLAIMGPSGAGKTSLLNALAGRLPKANKGELYGDIMVNGRPRDKSFRQMVGYVMQDDVFFSNLTVLETLTLAARLKLPKSMSKEEKMEVVQEVLLELSLVQAANTRIGGAGAGGISGGEKKRLNVATELITRAPILFLDEPTSNLDAFQALNVMNCLRKVASGGRAVVCTIHQPRSSIYALFDQLLLLSQGRIMYYGAAEMATDYFGRNSFKCPIHFNPADYFLDVIAIDQKTDGLKADGEARVNALGEAYLTLGESELVEQEVRALALGPEATIGNGRKYQVSWPEQFLLLSGRAFTQLMRDKLAFIIDVSVRLFFAILLGCIYFQFNNDQKSIQGRTGLLFFVQVQIIFAQLGAVQGTFPTEKLVVLRERQSKMYQVSAYYLAKTFAEFALKFWSPLLFAIIVYWMTWLHPTFVNFVIFSFILLILAALGTSLGLLVSALAPNVGAASVLGPLVVIIFMLGGGFYQNLDVMPVWLRWLQWISFFRYGYEAFMINEFHGTTFTCAGAVNNRCFQTGAEVLSYYSMPDDLGVMWRNVGILLGFVAGFHTIAYLLVRFKSANSFIPLNHTAATWDTKRLRHGLSRSRTKRDEVAIDMPPATS